eukprot:3663966-Rhodomonas_salina.3
MLRTRDASRETATAAGRALSLYDPFLPDPAPSTSRSRLDAPLKSSAPPGPGVWIPWRAGECTSALLSPRSWWVAPSPDGPGYGSAPSPWSSECSEKAESPLRSPVTDLGGRILDPVSTMDLTLRKRSLSRSASLARFLLCSSHCASRSFLRCCSYAACSLLSRDPALTLDPMLCSRFRSSAASLARSLRASG